MDESHPTQGLSAAGGHIGRQFFVTGFVVSLLSAGIFHYFATVATADAYRALGWGCIAVAGVFAFTGWWVRNAPVRRAVLTATWSAVGLVCMVSLGLGEGIHALALGFFSVLICVATVIAGARAGVAMAAFCALWVLALTGAELLHVVRGAAAVATSPLLMRAMTLWLMVASSVSVGMVVARVVAVHLIEARDTEARYQALFEQSPAALLLHRGGRLLHANRVARALIAGHGSWEHSNGAADPLPHPPPLPIPNDETDSAVFRAVLGHAQPLEARPVGTRLPTTEVVLPGGGGVERALQVSAVRAATDDGTATLSMFFDDSERREAERASRQSSALLDMLIDANPDSIILASATSNTIMMVNEAFRRVTGYSREALIGRDPVALGLWRYPAQRQQFRERLAAEGAVKDMAVVFVASDGSERQMQLSANGLEVDGVHYAAMVARDVTENEQTRLEQQAILSSAAFGIALTRNGLFTRANQACEAMFGYAPGEMAGTSVVALGYSEQAALQLRAVLHAALSRGGFIDTELKLKRCNGEGFWCRLSGRSVDPARPVVGGIVWVAEDVTERRRMADALAAARDAAEAASRAKSAFLANTSHEIRTPLNGLIGLTRIALQARTPADDRMQLLRQILDSAEHLGEIMGGVLDMSKIEAGKLALEARDFDLHELLTSLHAMYGAVATGRELRLVLKVSPAVPRVVFGDPVRVRQIVSNFISNALKFTTEGEISIAAESRPGDRVRITVRDTGIGIDAATLGHLFQPFTQADVSTTRRFGGTGLGLSICRELATLMGGEVGVASDAGRGSAFWAELPLAAVLPADASAVPPADASTDASAIWPGTDAAAAAWFDATGAAPGSIDGRIDGARVLLAEDNAINTIIATTLLKDWGAIVTAVGDGRAAVEAITTAAAAGTPFDLVLMDVQMPVLDGFAACRELRQAYDRRALPIVALTAGVLDAEREESIAAGMNAFLTKPFDERQLQYTLVRLLSRRA